MHNPKDHSRDNNRKGGILMRAIINPYSCGHPWRDKFLPYWSLCSIPLAGKHFCEYGLDFLFGLDVESVIVEDWANNSRTLRTTICNGRYIPMNVQYVSTSGYGSMGTLLQRNTDFISHGDVLIFWGMVLPMRLSQAELLDKLTQVNSEDRLEDGIYLQRGGKLFRCETDLRRITDIRSYFEQNFMMLNSPDGYVLPGYTAENGIYTGMNVAIRPDVEIKPPVVLCDNINIEGECSISDGAIIGSDVWIDQGTALAHSIVLDNTYVGKEILLDNKIISSGRIIDPLAEEFLDDNGGISMDMRGMGDFNWLRCYEYVVALVLSIVFLVPYIIYLPFRWLLSERLWAYKFSVDRYPKCLLVLLGKARLIKSGCPDDDYVFRMSDSFSMQMDEEQDELYDKFYVHNCSASLITRIVVKGLISRLFANRIPMEDAQESMGKPQVKIDNGILQVSLPQIRGEILSMRLPKLASVVLGGGYGRGEGGDFMASDGTHKLYNDLDFFVFTIDASSREKALIASKFESLGRNWSEQLGIDVEFAYPKNVSEIKKVKDTLMFQELRRGNVVVFGNDIVYTHVPLNPAQYLSFMEAIRLLMNRGMGLILAGEHLREHSSDYGFILRNMNKAVLGGMDAVLIVSRRYKWRLEERMSEVRALVADVQLPEYFVEMYDKACAFKLKPTDDMPEEPFEYWNSVRAFWCDMVRLCMDCEPDSPVETVLDSMHSLCASNNGRSLRNAARWIVRSHSLGKNMLGYFDDPVIRLLSRIYVILCEVEPHMEGFQGGDKELKRLWRLFN